MNFLAYAISFRWFYRGHFVLSQLSNCFNTICIYESGISSTFISLFHFISFHFILFPCKHHISLMLYKYHITPTGLTLAYLAAAYGSLSGGRDMQPRLNCTPTVRFRSLETCPENSWYVGAMPPPGCLSFPD